MNLYIETNENGPVNHPAFEDNLMQAFGEIPPHWEPFVRVTKPKPANAYEVVGEHPEYQKVDGVWTDVWAVREMTQEEKEVVVANLTEVALSQKPARITFINEQIANITDETGVALWQQCLAGTEAWELVSVDPLNTERPFEPPFPKMPHQDENGNWVETV